MLNGEQTLYVVGFLFDKDMSHVALITKDRPAWQKGRLNGIGGKLQVGELSMEAMAREANEEAGVLGVKWQQFCVLSGPEFCLYCFFAIGDPTLAKAQENEHVGCYDVELVLNGFVQTIPNVRWLIAMARSFREGEHAIGFCIREIYEKGTTD